MVIQAINIVNDPAFKQTFQYFETTGDYNSDTGEWEETASDPADGVGSIQPVPREIYHQMLQWMPEGARIKDSILVITPVKLIPAENHDPSGSTGHIVIARGLQWKVIDVEDYDVHGHVEAICVRVDNQEKANG